mmetsp:Transcript_45466/g.131622  ORF Transcript_45466/g.131622 Transcript_45466/m.131622 type:complete len:282 (+) Transcript_45466:94-939(+)
MEQLDVAAEIRDIDDMLESLRRQVVDLECRRSHFVAMQHGATQDCCREDIADVNSDVQEHVLVHLCIPGVAAVGAASRAWGRAAQRQSLWRALSWRDLLRRSPVLLRLLAERHAMVLSWRHLYAETAAQVLTSGAGSSPPGLQSEPASLAVGPDEPLLAVGVAAGPDSAPTTVGVGSDSDVAVPATTSTAAGVERSDRAAGAADVAVFATASTAAGVDRADSATGMAGRELWTTASVAVGAERADSATGMAGVAVLATASRGVGAHRVDVGTSTRGVEVAC